MIPCILSPDEVLISQTNAFIISITSFPLFAFYLTRYDEKTVVPINYLPYAYSHARRSVELDGVVLFIGRFFVLGFMALLMWAAILLGLFNAGDLANQIAIYAYYSLVLGVALIVLSSWGRREVPQGGKKVERSLIDLGLLSVYRSLETRLTTFKSILRSLYATRSQTASSISLDKDAMSEIQVVRHEFLSSLEEILNRLEAMQQISDQQLDEIRKRLARIEEKLEHKTD